MDGTTPSNNSHGVRKTKQYFLQIRQFLATTLTK